MKQEGGPSAPSTRSGTPGSDGRATFISNVWFGQADAPAACGLRPWPGRRTCLVRRIVRKAAGVLVCDQHAAIQRPTRSGAAGSYVSV